jgi:hypothetical protein
MPRRSYAELETTLLKRELNDCEYEVNPPKSLATAAQRDAWRELLFRYPHVTTKRGFGDALGLYVRLQARLRALPDGAEYWEVVRGVRHLEARLGLPACQLPETTHDPG